MRKKRILLSGILTIGLFLTMGKWHVTKEMAKQNLRWMQETGEIVRVYHDL